jgi:ATP-dependent RNA helicase MSS116
VAQAKTGTGKTIAFLLPLLQRMLDEDPSLALRNAARRATSDDVRGIVLSPTRELAEQIAAEARALTKNTGLVVQVAVGGTNKAAMLRQTQRQGCHLLVATPGRLNDLLHDTASGIEAPNLAALVLDEADRMLDVGFEKELNEILECLPSVQEKVRQTMLVSATIPDNVIRLARSMVRPQDFEFVQTIPENESLTHDKVPQKVVAVSSWANMFPSMFELMEREAKLAAEDPNAPPFKAIIYFNTTALVELAGEVGFVRRRERMSSLPSYCIHSKLSQMQRTRAAESFRKAKTGVLFSSDVTARGMDFPNVTHVIQMDAPRERESYIHRLGRTGRQSKDGEGWLLLPPANVRNAKNLLRGLPLKQDTSLESAEADISEGDLPHYFQQFKDAISTVPRAMLSSAYGATLSAHGREETAEDLHHWVTKGWGWHQVPYITQKLARNLGLSPHSEFVVIRRDDESSEGRFGGGSGGGNRSRGGFSRSRPSSDPFERMASNARGRNEGFRGGSRGGSRGGFSRGSRNPSNW